MKKQKKLRGSIDASAPVSGGIPSQEELLQTLAAQNRPMRLDALL